MPAQKVEVILENKYFPTFYGDEVYFNKGNECYTINTEGELVRTNFNCLYRMKSVHCDYDYFISKRDTAFLIETLEDTLYTPSFIPDFPDEFGDFKIQGHLILFVHADDLFVGNFHDGTIKLIRENSQIWRFENPVYCSYMKNDTCYYYNFENELSIETPNDMRIENSKYLYRSWLDDDWKGHVEIFDLNLKKLSEKKLKDIESIYSKKDLLIVKKRNGKYYSFNKGKFRKLKYKCLEITYLGENKYVVKADYGKFIIVNDKGKRIEKKVYKDVETIGLFYRKGSFITENESFMLDENLDTMIYLNKSFDVLKHLGKDLYAVEEDGLWSIINSSGKIITPEWSKTKAVTCRSTMLNDEVLVIINRDSKHEEVYTSHGELIFSYKFYLGSWARVQNEKNRLMHYLIRKHMSEEARQIMNPTDLWRVDSREPTVLPHWNLIDGNKNLIYDGCTNFAIPGHPDLFLTNDCSWDYGLIRVLN